MFGFSKLIMAAAAFLADMRLEMDYVLRQIENRSTGSVPIVAVTGYYDPITERDCVETNRLTADEWIWIDERAEFLNASIKNIVEKYDVAHFAEIDFSEHGICSDTPWVQGLAASSRH